VESRGGSYFFPAIEKGRVRKKLARSFYISDTYLKEPGGGEDNSILLLGEGHYISITSFKISTPLPLLISVKSLSATWL